jgi:hypothetical protein
MKLGYAFTVAVGHGTFFFPPKPKEFSSKRDLGKSGTEFTKVACRVGSKQICGFSKFSL